MMSSNIIPPLISTSPPPMNVNPMDDNDEYDIEGVCTINEDDDEEDDDDFGNFTSASIDCSYDALSLPTTPQDTPTKNKHNVTNHNCNVDEELPEIVTVSAHDEDTSSETRANFQDNLTIDNETRDDVKEVYVIDTERYERLDKDYLDKRKEFVTHEEEANVNNDPTEEEIQYVEAKLREILPSHSIDEFNYYEEPPELDLKLTKDQLEDADDDDDDFLPFADITNTVKEYMDDDDVPVIEEQLPPSFSSPSSSPSLTSSVTTTPSPGSSSPQQVEDDKFVVKEADGRFGLEINAKRVEAPNERTHSIETTEQEDSIGDITTSINDRLETLSRVTTMDEVSTMRQVSKLELKIKNGDDAMMTQEVVEEEDRKHKMVVEEVNKIDAIAVEEGKITQEVLFVEEEQFLKDDEEIVKKSTNVDEVMKVIEETPVDDENDDDFADFENFASAETNYHQQDVPTHIDVVRPIERIAEDDVEEDDGDDFADFDDYHQQFQQNEDGGKLEELYDVSSMGDIVKVRQIIEEVYDMKNGSDDVSEYVDDNNGQLDRYLIGVDGDRLFEQLKDITETVAINYAWNKSASQSALLKSLNIDMRNILHGLGWNVSVPKFAATLTNAPLQPIKSDIVASMPIQQQQQQQQNREQQQQLPTEIDKETVSSANNNNNNIPRAQFDWNSAGLTNPLSDFSQSNATNLLLLDMECLVASFDINNAIVVDNVDRDNKTIAVATTDTNLKNKLNEKLTETNDANDLENVWNCWLHCDSSNTSPNLTLRKSNRLQDAESVKSLQLYKEDDAADRDETKRELDDGDGNGDDERDVVDDDYTKKDAITSVLSNIEDVVEDDDDDFGVFQTGGHHQHQHHQAMNNCLRESHITNSNTTTTSNIVANNVNCTIGNEIETDIDDDFADFQMSLPPTSTVNSQPEVRHHHRQEEHVKRADVASIVSGDILKPTVVASNLQEQSNRRHADDAKNSQINWPDPGLTEDDLLNIEISLCNLKTNTNTNNKDNKQKNDVEMPIKNKVGDDGDNEFDANVNDVDRKVTKIVSIDVNVTRANVDPENIGKIGDDKCQQQQQKKKQQFTEMTGDNKSKKNEIIEEVAAEEEDEDWSDFVSSKDTPAVASSKDDHHQHNRQQRNNNNTSELQQLSVPQLHNLQPPKQPIPVITPHGLIQTKIPSNNNHNSLVVGSGAAVGVGTAGSINTNYYLSNFQTPSSSHFTNYGLMDKTSIFSCNTSTIDSYNNQKHGNNLTLNLDPQMSNYHNNNNRQMSNYNGRQMSNYDSRQVSNYNNQQMSNFNQKMSSHVTYLSNNSCYLLNSKPISFSAPSTTRATGGDDRNLIVANPVTNKKVQQANKSLHNATKPMPTNNNNNFTTITQQYRQQQQQQQCNVKSIQNPLTSNKSSVYNEDDWSDFISSPLPPTQQQQTFQVKTPMASNFTPSSTQVSGATLKQSISLPNQLLSVTAANANTTSASANNNNNNNRNFNTSGFSAQKQTNIIQNPINYDQSNRSYYYNNNNSNRTNTNVKGNDNNLTSTFNNSGKVTVPDLEFAMAPKAKMKQ